VLVFFGEHLTKSNRTSHDLFFGYLFRMRADRLVAIVLLLQRHQQLTARQLAEMLETSERTVRRDLDSLCVAGVPLYSQRGRAGGWSILGGHRLDLSGFTVEEARALFMVSGAQSGPGLRSALRKVLAALPEPLKDEASAAERASYTDPYRWGSKHDDPPALADLQAAVLTRVQVEIHYRKPGHDPEWRRVHPYGLVAKAGTWYLLAGTPAGRRTFRVSRIGEVAATDDAAVLPERFDLAEEWQRAERDFASRMSLVEVELEVAHSAVLRLTSMLRGWVEYREIEHEDEENPKPKPTSRGRDRNLVPSGWRRLRAAFPHLEVAAVNLAPFGADIRVSYPLALRRRLAEIGEGLVKSHAG
jgi:predicted DNA-binding transcriptional regulator YafY